MLALEIRTQYVSAPKLLTILQTYQQDGEAEKHAETSAVALAHLSANPGYMASRFLPLVLDFIDRNGASGVEGLVLSSLSAAAAHDVKTFRHAIDRLALMADRLSVSEDRPEFGIPFIDFDSIPATRVPVRAAKTRDGRYGSGQSGQVLSGIIAEFTGNKDPETLQDRFGFGAEIIQNLLNSSHTDAARKLIEDLAKLTAQSEFGLLPGFGLTVRGGANSLDKAAGSGAEKAANNWKKTYEAVAKLARQANEAQNRADQAMAAARTAAWAGLGIAEIPAAAPVGVGVAIGGAVAGGIAAGVKLQASWFAKLIKEIEEKIEKAEKAEKGTTDKTDKEKTKKMPLPDDFGDAKTRIADYLEAATAYASRINPYINPTGESFGGVVYAKVPVQGDIDPVWEDISIDMSEEDLIAWLGFLQRKLFDSRINPVRRKR